MKSNTAACPHFVRHEYLRIGLLMVLILFDASFARAETAKPSDDQVLTWLRQLKPLPKVHYSWPLPFGKLSDDILYEYARLTHAVSLSGEWGTPEQIDRAVSICKRVNGTKPKAPASIGINYSVWHRRFGKDLEGVKKVAQAITLA